jgi:hypothetical protein
MKRHYNQIKVNFESDRIHFPKGYFFKQSEVHLIKEIRCKDIAEINPNTFPPSLVYQNNEVIFLKPKLKEELLSFAKQHNNPIIERFDIWEHVNRCYLDTEFEAEDTLASLKLLSKNGISEIELKTIRKKIAKTMFLNTFIWEWVYLGLFDYLNWTFLTKKKYWWAMEISLRNFTPKH